MSEPDPSLVPEEIPASKRSGKKLAVILLELLAVLVLVFGIGFGAFVWRVSQGPISIGFAKDYVQDSLSNKEDGIRVTFDDMVFSWPELKGPFLLDLSGLHVAIGAGEDNTLTVDSASVGLSRRALMLGHVRPVSVILKSPSLELVREKNGGFNLSVQKKQVPQASAADEEDAGKRIATFYKDMANHTKGKLFARLNAFEIRNASVAVTDRQYGKFWQMSDLDFAMKERKQGIASSLRAVIPGEKGEKTASVGADMVYRKASDDFAASLRLDSLNPYVLSRLLPLPEDALAVQDVLLSGRGEATFDSNMNPLTVRFEGGIPVGNITVPDQYDTPIPVKDVKIRTEFNASEKTVDVPLLSGEIGGIAFTGQGNAHYDAKSLSVPLQLKLAEADLAQVLPLFPKSEKNGNAYKWLGERIKGGRFRDVSLDMEVSGAKGHDQTNDVDAWAYDLPKFKLGFAFDGADVHYSETLMPVTNASGKGVLDLAAETLDITDAKATLGDIQGENVSVRVTELMTSGGGYVTVKAALKGPIATALDYIADDPIGMNKDQIGIDADKVKGTLDASIEVALPTVHDVPKDEVKVTINGTLNDILLPDAVEGLSLTGGPLVLKTEEGGFRLAGKAKLDGRDTDLDWHQYFSSEGHPYSMQVKAKVAADSDLRNHFGVDLDDYITGTLPVDVLYTRKSPDSTVEVSGDLMPVTVHIKTFQYEKPPGVAGTVKAKAVLKSDALKEINGLSIDTDGLNAKDAKLMFAARAGKKAALDQGSFPDVTIGKTKLSGSFATDAKGVMDIKAKAPVFDLMPFLKETEASTRRGQDALDEKTLSEAAKEKRQPLRITIKADKMPAQNDQTAKNTKAYIETDPDGDITRLEYDATIGKAPLLVRFSPNESGKRVFRMSTNDAGAVLKTFGLYENIVGGRLVAYAEPKGSNLRGDLYGTMRMENIRIVRAPALASILSLMSLTGVRDLLGNEGLVFEKLESAFEWRFRPEGNLLIVKDGKTSGSSIGLTFAGYVDRGKKTTNIAGTIIPMSGLGAVLAKVPVIGTILGGAGGLIAATYKMEGPTSKPKVSVNPLSFLAPGILRSILFEGGYENEIPDNDDKPVKDEKQKSKVRPVKQDDRTQATR